MKYKVISFYTLGTGYEEEAKALGGSLARFDIPHDIVGIKSLGGWIANTMHKPVFIREMLDKHSDALVWLDADAIVLRSPVFFSAIHTDVGLYYRTTGPAADRFGGYELITATMYFANNDRVRTLLEMWIEQTKREHDDRVLVEQRSLQRVLAKWQMDEGDATVTYLPQSYCRIFDAPEDHRVIVQNQASRKYADDR